MKIPLIGDLMEGVVLDRIRKWFGRRDARRYLCDELAAQLLDYRQKLMASRLLLQRGLPSVLRAIGEGDLAEQIRPSPRLLELVSLKFLAHDLPSAEALRAIFGSVNWMVDAKKLCDQQSGHPPLDDAAVARLLTLSGQCDETISYALEALRADVSPAIRQRLDPEALARGRQVEEIIREAGEVPAHPRRSAPES